MKDKLVCLNELVWNFSPDYISKMDNKKTEVFKE